MENSEQPQSRSALLSQDRALKSPLMANTLPDASSNSSGSGCGPTHNARQATMTLEQYRLQLYNYALNIERLRCPQFASGTATLTPWMHPYGSHGSVSNRMATLSTISLFPQSQRIFQPEEPKPQHSYIGLIAMAILSSADQKLVLSDIYQYILDNYAYFRTRGPGWRNSIRHNLSLNDCFIKSGRSANGKGHYWAIHPANMDDFRKGDFRRRKAQRKVRISMGLSVDDTSSPSPPPLDLTTPPPSAAQSSMQLTSLNYPYHHHYIGQFFGRSMVASTMPNYTSLQSLQREQVHQVATEQQIPKHIDSSDIQQPQHQHIAYINSTTTTTIANLYSQTRKRQFDVASLLAPDVQIVDIVEDKAAKMEISDTPSTRTTTQHTVITKVQVQKQHTLHHKVVVDLEEQNASDADVEVDVDIDVVDASDAEEQELGILRQRQSLQHHRQQQHSTHIIQKVFPAEENISYLSNTRRSLSDADAEEQRFLISPLLGGLPDGLQTSGIYSQSLGSGSSQHDSNSLEECPMGETAENLNASSTSSSKVNGELSHVDPHILTRYYGTYMAAAAARHTNLETSRAKSLTPPIELVSHQSTFH